MKKICFFGESGSGKSTTASIFTNMVRERGYEVKMLNVAQPLHQIQGFAYKKFGIRKPGQDGVLLQFLASHFEDRLGLVFEKACSQIKDAEKLFVVNSDCRNNCYHILRKLGFIFVRIVANDWARAKRLNIRGDVTRGSVRADVEAVSLIRADQTIENNGSVEDLAEKVKALMLYCLRCQV